MRADHYAEWDLHRTNFRIDRLSLAGTDSVTLAAFSADRKWHVLGLFAAELETAMNDAWGSGHTVTWSDANLTYTIDGLDSDATYQLTVDAMQILGLSEPEYVGPTAALVSDVRPYYVVRPWLDDVSNPSHDFEEGGLAAAAYSDAGIPFGTARTSGVTKKSWAVEFEPRAQTLAHYATSAIPFTWEHFVKHARTVYSIALITSVDDGEINGINVGRLTEGHASFTQQVRSRHVESYDDHWRLNFEIVTTGLIGLLPPAIAMLLTEDGYPIATEHDQVLLLEQIP